MSTASNIPAVLLPASFLREITVIEITPELSSMYPIIGCDLVERVALAPAYHAAIWVDEEGLLKDAPINLRASCIAGHAIYGDAILAGEDAECNIVPLLLNCPSLFFKSVEEEVTRLMKECLYQAK
jgi:hypothetical protein